MAKIFVSIFVVLYLSTVCKVESGVVKNGQCEQWDIKFDEGQTISIPGVCQQATCANPQTNKIITLGCPMYKLREGCHLSKEDLSEPYPACCPHPICPGD